MNVVCRVQYFNTKTEIWKTLPITVSTNTHDLVAADLAGVVMSELVYCNGYLWYYGGACARPNR